MTPAEAKKIIERLCGEFEVQLTSDNHDAWVVGLTPLNYGIAFEAVDRTLDRDEMPSVDEFRRMVGARSSSRTSGRCNCLNGWTLPSAQNYVVACHQCFDGEARAMCVEQYRAERDLWRRALRSRGDGTTSTDHSAFIEAARGALRDVDDPMASPWGQRVTATPHRETGEDYF